MSTVKRLSKKEEQVLNFARETGIDLTLLIDIFSFALDKGYEGHLKKLPGGENRLVKEMVSGYLPVIEKIKKFLDDDSPEAKR